MMKCSHAKLGGMWLCFQATQYTRCIPMQGPTKVTISWSGKWSSYLEKFATQSHRYRYIFSDTGWTVPSPAVQQPSRLQSCWAGPWQRSFFVVKLYAGHRWTTCPSCCCQHLYTCLSVKALCLKCAEHLNQFDWMSKKPQKGKSLNVVDGFFCQKTTLIELVYSTWFVRAAMQVYDIVCLPGPARNHSIWQLRRITNRWHEMHYENRLCLLVGELVNFKDTIGAGHWPHNCTPLSQMGRWWHQWHDFILFNGVRKQPFSHLKNSLHISTYSKVRTMDSENPSM